MINSSIQTLRDKLLQQKKKRAFRLWAILFWVASWQIVSMLIGQEILLASPVSVFLRLFDLLPRSEFWSAVWFTFIRIIAGFLLALATAIVFAALSARFSRFKELLSPLMSVIKATPVASFTILILIWVSSKNLSLFMALLMVLPVIYSNVLSGIENTDAKLLEMAEVFRVPPMRRLRFIYIPQILPFFRSACKVSLGLCWKAGVAAEVIGMPNGSIGEKLYQAKIYLETPDLFAWTVVIIAVSVVFEKLFLLMLDRIVRLVEEM